MIYRFFKINSPKQYFVRGVKNTHGVRMISFFKFEMYIKYDIYKVPCRNYNPDSFLVVSREVLCDFIIKY